MTVRVEWETEAERMESCDHVGMTEALDGSRAISTCAECGKTWPARLGPGAATVRVIEKQSS